MENDLKNDIDRRRSTNIFMAATKERPQTESLQVKSEWKVWMKLSVNYATDTPM